MELLVSILALGSTYALLAAGIVIIYKASRVINFAHGELAIVGAYVFHSAGFLTGATLSGPSLLVAIAISAIGSAAVRRFHLFLFDAPPAGTADVRRRHGHDRAGDHSQGWNRRDLAVAQRRHRRSAASRFSISPSGGRIAWID